jgi:hypothetical protein
MNSAISPGKITFHRAYFAAKVSRHFSRSPQRLRAIQLHGITYRRNDERERNSCNGHQPSYIKDAIGRSENASALPFAPAVKLSCQRIALTNGMDSFTQEIPELGLLISFM